MRNSNLMLLLGVIIFNSCSKSNNITQGPPEPNTTFKIKKRILSMSLSSSSLPPDSIICSFTYDNENKPVNINYDEIYRSQNYEIKRIITLNYSSNTIEQTQAFDGSSLLLKTIYYLNPTTKSVDSLVEKTLSNNNSIVSLRASYASYNIDGCPGIADSTLYNAGSGELIRTSHSVYTWMDKNIISITTSHSTGSSFSHDYTYGNAELPAKTSPTFNFISGIYYEYVVPPFNKLPITKKVTRNSSPLEDWKFEYTADALGRIVSRKDVLKVQFSAVVYTGVWTYIY